MASQSTSKSHNAKAERFFTLVTANRRHFFEDPETGTAAY